MITITQLDAMTAMLEDYSPFRLALELRSLGGMQLVLKAHGFDYTPETAQSLININL